MYSKFPLSLSLSLERLPRARRCGCLSLRAGCVLTALVCILYAVLALSECIAEAAAAGGAAAEAGAGAEQWAGLQWAWFSALLLVLVTSLSLSALMLVGALRDKAWMMRPWVVLKALQLGGSLLLFVVGGVLHLPPAPLPARPALPGAAAAGQQPLLLSLAVEFLVILVRFYMLTIVASHCQQLEDEELINPLTPLSPLQGRGGGSACGRGGAGTPLC